MDIDECEDLVPCQNDGLCLNDHGGYDCLCPDGFEGTVMAKSCHTFTNSCTKIPQFTGSNCEIYEENCPVNICLNNGICLGSGLNFTCVCPMGFR